MLLDEQSLNYLGPLTRMAAAAGRRIDDLLTAYRDGGGVSWDAFGDDARESQAALNRPWFTQKLAPALAGVPELARRPRPARRPDPRRRLRRWLVDPGPGRAYPDATWSGSTSTHPRSRPLGPPPERRV